MKSRVVLLGLVMGSGLLACEGRAFEPSGAHALTEAVAGSAPSARRSAALSSATQAGFCRDAPPPDNGTVPRSVCDSTPGDMPSASAVRAIAAAAQGLSAELSADAMHAVGLADLLWSSGVGKSIDRSISLLSDATRTATSRRSALLDLAAAYMRRAESMQSPADLVASLDAAIEASETDGRTVERGTLFPARFNAALAMSRLMLVTEADAAWHDLNRIDPPDNLARETGARALDASTIVAEPSSLDDVQTLREQGWRVVLPAWARAHQAGDAVASAASLDSAEHLAERIRALGGDPSLTTAVGVIRSRLTERNTRDLAALAQGHLVLATADSLYRTLAFDESRALLAGIAGRPVLSPALHAWTQVAYARALNATGESVRALILLSDVASSAAARTLPAARAQAEFALGTFALRRGDHETGVLHLRTSEELYRTIGERESLGATQFALSEAFFEIGQADEGYTTAHRALLTLRTRPASVWRHNTLQTLVRAAMLDRRFHAAVRIASEDVANASRLPLPEHALEAYLARARAFTALNQGDRARADLNSVARILPTLSPRGRAFLAGDVQIAEAALNESSRANRAALDSAVAEPARRVVPARLILALQARARSRLARLDSVGAAADLDSIAGLVERKHSGIEKHSERVALLGLTEPVSAQLAAFALARGASWKALSELERSRRPFLPGADNAVGEQEAGSVVVFAFVSDSLRAWVRRGRSVQLVSTGIARADFERELVLANAGLEEGATAAAVQAPLGRLYEWLIAPVASLLPTGADVGLHIVPYGVIADVPFAALWDAKLKQHLVERFALTMGWSSEQSRVANASAAAGARAIDGRSVTIVADPLFRRADYPTLDALPGADAEAREIASGYGKPSIIGGLGAERATVMLAMSRATVFHFAGHALVDDQRPERSVLVLAGQRAQSLSADAIASIDLSRVELVVLSACTGVASRRASGRAMADLADAFLAAGAGGVIASPWRVDDMTTRALMVRMHEAYRVSRDGAAALRTAQRAMMTSSDATQRVPGAWAAFRHITR